LQQIGPFEMRRLEALSNTIFGVAMTLLAYDLPKASVFKNAPTWIDLVRAYAQPLIALMISFIVAGLFWFSHHRRLSVAPEGSRGEVFLNLIFLVSIIILPVTNGLRSLSARRRRRRALRGPPDCHRDAERAAVVSRAQRSRQSRVADNRDLSRLRIPARDRCRRHRPTRCAIHMVSGIWRASGGLDGGAALAKDATKTIAGPCIVRPLYRQRHVDSDPTAAPHSSASHFRECS
jgi:hypothetical protein